MKTGTARPANDRCNEKQTPLEVAPAQPPPLEMEAPVPEAPTERLLNGVRGQRYRVVEGADKPVSSHFSATFSGLSFGANRVPRSKR